MGSGGRRARGLTLAELALAMALLALLILSMVGLFTTLLASSTKSSNLTAGTLVAQRVLQRAVDGGPPFEGDGEHRLAMHEGQAATRFVYSITSEQLYAPPGPLGAEASLLTVQVYWWVGDPGEARRGSGRLSTELQRVVHVTR